jgi:hypothetical protein
VPSRQEDESNGHSLCLKSGWRGLGTVLWGTQLYLLLGDAEYQYAHPGGGPGREGGAKWDAKRMRNSELLYGLLFDDG